MKSRLSASISLRNLGETGRSFCFTNAFSSSLNFVPFNGRRRAFSRCQYQGFQTLRTVSYSSDDDFADLGPPSEGLATQLKLLTQKPELKVRNGPKTKGLSQSSSRGSPHNIYQIFRHKPFQTSNSIVKDCDYLSGRHGDMKNPSNLDSSCSVAVEDVTKEVAYRDRNSNIMRNSNKPSQTSNLIVKDCANLSGRHGDMRNPINLDSSCSVTVEDVTDGVAYRDRNSNILRNSNKPSQTKNSIVKDCNNLSGRYGNMDSSCSVKVEDVANEVACCDSNFQIVTIRIQGIAKVTTDHIIHSICKSIGALEGLMKVDDAVDVLFRVKNDADSQHIVKRLNDTVIDDSQWSAFNLPKISTSTSSGEDARSKIGLQIYSRLHDIKQQLEYKRLCLQDLLSMHRAVMQLENLSTTLDPQKKH